MLNTHGLTIDEGTLEKAKCFIMENYEKNRNTFFKNGYIECYYDMETGKILCMDYYHDDANPFPAVPDASDVFPNEKNVIRAFITQRRWGKQKIIDQIHQTIQQMHED